MNGVEEEIIILFTYRRLRCIAFSSYRRTAPTAVHYFDHSENAVSFVAETKAVGCLC